MQAGVGVLINSLSCFYAAIIVPDVKSSLISLKRDDEHQRTDNLLIRLAALYSENGLYLVSYPLNDMIFNLLQVT